MDYVIIGGSAAGVSCAEALRKHDKDAGITLISDESFPLYSRCLLTYLIAGSLNESELNFKDRDFYAKNRIKTYLGKKAVAIDAKRKTVSLEDKTSLFYDKLLLATGASPKWEDVPGAHKRGVFTVRTIDDARKIMAMLEGVKEVAVLGGGLIGLRDAYALSLRKKQVSVLVKSPQILSQMLDADAAHIIAQVLEKNGIRIMTGVAAKEILGAAAVEEIVLDNGQKLSCQMVIIGKGVAANTQLALSGGLKVKEGIVVDKFLRTGDPNIYAAGDCAETLEITLGEPRINALWPCAVEQGEIAALNMLKKEAAYDGSLAMNSVDFFGVACISMGITKTQKEDDYEILCKELPGRFYKKVALKENRIVGMVLVGDIKTAGIVHTLIKHRMDISSIKHLLLEDSFDYAKIMPLIKEFRAKFKQEEFQDTILSWK